MRNATGPKTPVLARLVQQFFTEYLVAQRALSPCTVACYRDALMLFLGFAGRHLQGLLDHANGEGVEVGRQGLLQFLKFGPEGVVHEAAAEAGHHGGAARAAGAAERSRAAAAGAGRTWCKPAQAAQKPKPSNAPTQGNQNSER